MEVGRFLALFDISGDFKNRVTFVVLPEVRGLGMTDTPFSDKKDRRYAWHLTFADKDKK